MRGLDKWLRLIRANFLLLTPAVFSSGLSASIYDGHPLRIFDLILALIAALFTHISVNVLNNYFDYVSGIDAKTTKTPFSGGVEVLLRGEVRPQRALCAGLAFWGGAGMIAIRFLRLFPRALLPIVLFASISILVYTKYLSRISGLSEPIAGVNFGLMSLWAYATQAGSLGLTSLIVFVPVSVLVGILLFLNEFPDVEPDTSAGRRHWVILLGRRRASRIYALLLALTYLYLVASVLLRFMPITSLLALATCPLAIKAARIVLTGYNELKSLIRAMALNVFVVLGTIALLAAGLVIGSVF